MRLLLAIPLFSMSLLSVFRAPHIVLWKPAILATEWGHVLAILALMVAVPLGWDRAGQLATGLALVAMGVFLTPWIRAQRVRPGGLLRVAFGESVDEASPLRVGDLLQSTVERAAVRTEILEGGRRVDLYGVGTGTARPVVVAIHGGSWNSGDRTQLADTYHWLAGRGWAVAAIEYRLAPGHKHPAQLEDVRFAVAWVRERAAELHIDAEHVVLYGRSAGGHLALLAAHLDGGVDGVVALYAPTDMVWSWNNPGRILDTAKTLSEYLGGSLHEAQDTYARSSPLSHVRADGPPTLLVHGGRDELVWPEQSERMPSRLQSLGVPHVLLSLPWATHGCEANLAGPSGQLFRWTLERFLQAVIRRAGGVPPAP